MGFVLLMHIHAYLGMYYDARKYNLIQFSMVYCIALKMATKQKIPCYTIAYDTIKDSMVQYNAMKIENWCDEIDNKAAQYNPKEYNVR